MPTPIREAILAAVAGRLTAQLSGVTVLRARRAPVAQEERPAVVLVGGGLSAAEDVSFGETMWTCAFTVVGHFAGATDLAAEQAGSDLHARVVAALQGWDIQPTVPAAIQANVTTAEFGLYGAEDSAKPAGEFAAEFTATAMLPNGSPYTA